MTGPARTDTTTSCTAPPRSGSNTTATHPRQRAQEARSALRQAIRMSQEGVPTTPGQPRDGPFSAAFCDRVCQYLCRGEVYVSSLYVYHKTSSCRSQQKRQEISTRCLCAPVARSGLRPNRCTTLGLQRHQQFRQPARKLTARQHRGCARVSRRSGSVLVYMRRETDQR